MLDDRKTRFGVKTTHYFPRWVEFLILISILFCISYTFANASTLLYERDYSAAGMGFNRSGLNTSRIAETFTPTSTMAVSSVSFELARNVTGTGEVYLYINSSGTQPENGSTFLASSSIAINNVSTTSSWVSFALVNTVLYANTNYWFILYGSNLDDPLLTNTTPTAGGADWARCVGCGGVYNGTNSWGNPSPGGPGSIRIYGSFSPLSIVYPSDNSTVNLFPAFKVDYGWLASLLANNTYILSQLIYSESSTLVNEHRISDSFNSNLHAITWTGVIPDFTTQYMYKFYSTAGFNMATGTTYYAKLNFYTSSTSFTYGGISDSDLYTTSDIINFTTGNTTTTSGEIPSVFSGLAIYSCDEKELSVWNPSDWGCVVGNILEDIKTVAKNSASAVIGTTYEALSGVFPLSVIHDFDDILQEVSSTGNNDIVLTGYTASSGVKIFGGAAYSFSILTSSTALDNIKAKTNYDMRALLTSIIYSLLGVLMLITTIFVIKMFMSASSSNKQATN